MDEKEKLRHLLGHWEEHNKEHADNYRQWADKMDAIGEKEAARILKELADKTDELGSCFDKLNQSLI